MKRKYYIYTDASVKEKEHAIAIIITRNHNIVEVYYKHFSKHTNPSKAEHKAVQYAIKRMCEIYHVSKADYTIYCDFQPLSVIHKKQVKWIKGHKNHHNAAWKYKFNCLADYVAKKGLIDWRDWWYNNKF